MSSIEDDEVMIEDARIKRNLAMQALDRATKKLNRRAQAKVLGIVNYLLERIELDQHDEALAKVKEYTQELEAALEDAGKPEARRRKKTLGPAKRKGTTRSKK
jgi:hypothetical protein